VWNNKPGAGTGAAATRAQKSSATMRIESMMAVDGGWWWMMDDG